VAIDRQRTEDTENEITETTETYLYVRTAGTLLGHYWDTTGRRDLSDKTEGKVRVYRNIFTTALARDVSDGGKGERWSWMV
jgi:hypothetical protein